MARERRGGYSGVSERNVRSMWHLIIVQINYARCQDVK